MIAGAVSPALLRWIRRTGHRRRAVDLKMTVVVERPVGEVFQFCRDFENFPTILDVLDTVEDHQDGRSHWVVRAPDGARLEWDAVVTKYVPNSVIAWESTAGSPVRATGLMRFFPLGDAETRVDLVLTYRPGVTSTNGAARAMARRSNSELLRSSVARASRELSQLGAEQRAGG